MDTRTISIGIDSWRPKVGFVQPWDRCAPPSPGGAMGWWIWEVVRRLADSYDVLVCGPLLQGDSALEEHEGVHFVRLPLAADMYLAKLTERLRHQGKLRKADFASHLYRRVFAERAARILRSHGCGVIQILNLSQFVPIMRRVNPHAKIILHMECDWLAGLDPVLVESGLREADAIVSCSDYITSAICKRFPHYSDKCKTIYNGVDLSEFAPASRADGFAVGPKVVFVNRISPEKGLHVLLDAFKQVLARRPEATLEIIGPDYTLPLEAVTSLKDNTVVNGLSQFYQDDYPMQMRARVHNDDVLRRRVTFAGLVPHAQLASRLSQMDILVQPSVFDEPFGIPIVEAMASGLPVIGSSAGGIPELIVEGQTGLLVDRDNPSALANALLWLMDNPVLAKAMGIVGPRRAQDQFSWERITADLKSCYFDPPIPSYHPAKARGAMHPL